jgi:methionyl-tRNA formyltransferase
MKFAFVTCVQLGLSCLEAIHESGTRLDLILTLEDNQAVKKSGRVFLEAFCQRHGVDLLKVRHINDSRAIEEIKARGIDWLFIIGWSQVAGPAVLNAPRLGTLGIHPTLLPQGRGRAAIPWAILKRLPKTGVTLFKLDEGVDTGPIVAQKEIALSAETDAAWLYDEVNRAHITLIREVLPALVAGNVPLLVQVEKDATTWPGRKPEDGEINREGSVLDAECLVRAVTRPYPGAFTVVDGKQVTIWKARIVPQPRGELSLSFVDGHLECLDYQYQ